MKKTLIVIIIIIILAAIGWAIYDHNNSGNSTSYGTNPSASTQQATPTSNNPGPTSAQPATSGHITITSSMIFTPSQITVAKGSTVTWTNNDAVAHTVTDDLSNVGGPASGDIEPGGTYSFTFNKTGSFQYHCTIHPQMRGTIVVK